MPYQAAGIHSNKQSCDLDTNRDVHLLDTVAIALTTGNPGDVFAAAFDKRQHIRLILAQERVSYTRGHICCKRTHFSYQESHCHRRNGPISLPDPSVWNKYQQADLQSAHICLSEMFSSATTSCWHCRRTHLRLIFEPSFLVRTRFLGIMGMQCHRSLLSGEILLK